MKIISIECSGKIGSEKRQLNNYNIFSNYAQCIVYNKTYAFNGFLAHISLKIKAKAA